MNHPKTKKYCGFVSPEQKKELILFMEEYPELKSGKFNQNFSTRTAQKLWMILRDKLNALAGANKDWKQWRKTWQDMKSKTKKKNTERKNYQMGTGGGPAVATNLDSDEEKIIKIIGPVLVEGDGNIKESACDFSFDDDDAFESSTGAVESSTAAVESSTGALECSTGATECSTGATECPTGAVKSSSVEHSINVECLTTSKKKARSRIQRFNKTIEANAQLIELTKEKNDLYKRDVAAKESIAESLKTLVEYLLRRDK